MSKPYKVGDTVWFARCGQTQVTKPCPVCYETRQVTLILGNGDKIILPCNYCDRGYIPPTGTITEYEYLAEPKQIKISQVDSKQTKDGATYEYHSLPNYYHDEHLLFDTRDEALAKCIEIKDAYEEGQITRAENIKESKHKSFSWNAGYHMREAKRERKSAEYHEKMAAICKQRAPEEKP